MNQNPSYSSQGVTPAMIAAFQHQKSNIFGAQSNGGNINPAQFVNVNGSVNPTQLLQQQPHNGMSIPGGGSINPAALTAASPSSPSPFPQQQHQQQHFNSMLQVVGMTRDQFQSLSHQDRQAVGEKYRSVFNAHQQQQQQQMAMINAGMMNNNNNNAFSNQPQPQNFYDRPSSSASSHSQQPQPSSSQQPSSSAFHHMMPPPPPRPPTAQGGQSQGHSRPSTSQARSPIIPGGQQSQMLEMMQMKEMMQQGQQRSQSRMGHRGDSMMNGFNGSMGLKPSNHQQGLFTGHQHLSQHSQQPQSQPQSQSSANTSHQQNQYSSLPQSTSSPPAMGSPYRGAARKLGGDMGSASGSGGMKIPGMGGPGSPRIGGGLGPGNLGSTALAAAGIMGPPGLPRSVSGDSMNMNMMGNNNPNPNAGSNINGQQRQSPRPQSSMGINADIASRLGVTPPSSQQHQRQGSVPPQFSNPQQQQPMRQGSLPPGTGPSQQQQQQRQKMGQDGMNMNIGGGGMGLGGGMGMGMKTNNAHSTSSTSSKSHMPVSPLLGGGPGPQGMVSSLSVSSIGSNIAGAQTTLPLIQQTPMDPASISSPSTSNSGLTAVGVTPDSTPLTTAIASTATAATVGAPSNTSSLPPLPPVNASTTQITTVPLSTAHLQIPVLTSSEISQIQEWKKTDQKYEVLLGKSKERMVGEVREALGTGSSVGGTGALGWWEMPGTGNFNKWRRRGEMFDVRYPRTRREREREREREGRGRKSARREGLKLPRVLELEEVNRPEELVPLRIEFDVEHHRMRDTFVWNLNDPIVTPEAFAQSLVEDYTLAPSYHSIIVKTIQDQLSDFKAHSANYDGESGELLPSSPSIDHKNDIQDPIRGVLDDEGIAWWMTWRKRNEIAADAAVRDSCSSRRRAERVNNKQQRKRRKIVLDPDEDGDIHMFGDNEQEDDPEKEEKQKTVKPLLTDHLELTDEDFRPMALNEIKIDEQAMHEDIRILIKLDIIVGSIKLDDQFEWDLDNEMASPEEFAEVYTRELGLGGEFRTAISHSIREQVQTYQKSLFLVGHPSDGSIVQDEDLKLSFLPSLTSGARPVAEVQMFTPLLNYLSDGEVERTEKERDKDLNKRRKRNTRGRRGIALPDREPIRTYRTPAIGFPELDAATLALAAAASAPMSRRAAAAAASVTIANMVASENGTPFLPQMMPSTTAPQPPPMTASKEKKPKGLFKPPAFPPSVLRARAKVAAPTTSTALDVSSTEVSADNEAPRSSPSAVPVSSFALDSKNSKIFTARRAKELEREAKEKEFVDGQHPNYIDGVWHCSNCGCPESIAIGRRKGPLGDKSQCGTCGKFWHRHRRPRPVTYNPDPDFHSGVKPKDSEGTKTPAKRKGAAAALRAQSTTASATPADISAPQTPTRSNGGDVGEPSSRKSPTPNVNKDDDDRAISPVSTASSASEPPLAQKVKMNGNHTTKRPTTPTPGAPALPVTPKQPDLPTSNSVAPPSSGPATSTQTASPSRAWLPQWLSGAMQAMRAKYPTDRFEVTLRKANATSTPEWRIKCQDCPGKLYTPGPGETLSNYEVHLKNRKHRQRVNERLGNIPPPTS